MKSFLEYCTFDECLNAAIFHLGEGKEHLKLNQLDDLRYELTMVVAHIDMCSAIIEHKRQNHSSNKPNPTSDK